MELFTSPGFYIACLVFLSLLLFLWLPFDLNFDENDDLDD